MCCSYVQAYPQEKVGVFVQRGRGGPLSVVEYSEMDAAMTTEINQSTGRRVIVGAMYDYIICFLLPFHPSSI